MSKRTIKAYINTTYFFIFLPYLSLGIPLNSDIQPFAGGLALLYIIIHIRQIRFSRIAILLFLFSLLAMAWAVFIDSENKLIIKILAYPYALIIYLFIYNTISEDVIRSAKKYAVIYILAVFFQFLFPAVYVQIFGKLVREINVPEIGGLRGVSALTTEPSFTAFILFTFFIILRYSHVLIRGRPGFLMGTFLVIGMALTKATSGMAMFLLLLMYEGVKKLNIFRVLVIGLAFVLFYFSIEYFGLDRYRAINFIVNAASSPEKILYSGSLFIRVYALTAGVVALIYNPFGLALGNVSINAIKVTTDNIFYGHTFPNILEYISPGINMPSALGAGLLIFGSFYFIFYISIFFPVYLKKDVPMIVKILIFAFTAQSYSFAFPLLWLLMVMSEKGYWRQSHNDIVSGIRI